MSDAAFDDLVRGLARVSDGEVARWDLAGPEREMCEAIMSTEPTTTTPDLQAARAGAPASAADPADTADCAPDGESDLPEVSLTRQPPRRRRLVATVLGVAAAAASIVAGLVIARDPGDEATTVPAGDPGGDRGPDTTGAAPATDGTVPRLLVDLPGWAVERVDERAPEEGETVLTDGEQTLEVHWQSADQHQWKLDDLAESNGPGAQVTVLGHPAQQFVRNEPPTAEDTPEGSSSPAALGDYETLWLDGAISVGARGTFRSIEAYQAVLDALVEADDDRWTAALPASAVPPDARAAAVDVMLQDIPMPPEIDLDALRHSDLTVDRYQLGAEVTRVVTCRWLDAWAAAEAAGDTGGVQRAVDAMTSSHDWQILLDMDDEGDWPESIWEYADALPTDARSGPGDAFTVEETYSQGFGCDPNAPAGF